MNVGDIVTLQGSMYSSYQYQGQTGLVIEKVNLAHRSGFPEASYCKVMWFKDAKVTSVKEKHLENLKHYEQ